MSDEYWVGRDDESFDVDVEESQTCLIAGGELYDVNPNETFKDAVLRVADSAGYGKFRVFLNGAEVKPSEAPQFIVEGSRVEVRPYDQAG